MRWLLGRSCFAEAVPLPPPGHWRRSPPVGATEQPHRRRHQQSADHGRIDRDRDHQPDPDHLHEHDARGGERADHDDQQQRRAGDDPAGPLQAEGNGLAVVTGPVVLLPDPAEQEHLVVHRQPEQYGEQQHRVGRVEEAGRGEVEQAGQVAVLEDPHHRTERGGQRQHVHQQRLGRQHNGAEGNEQQHERHQYDEPGHPRRPLAQYVSRSTSAAVSPPDLDRVRPAASTARTPSPHHAQATLATCSACARPRMRCRP